MCIHIHIHIHIHIRNIHIHVHIHIHIHIHMCREREICIYIYIYIYITHPRAFPSRCTRSSRTCAGQRPSLHFAKGVQWTQGVVIYMTLSTSCLCNTTPIHFTPDPLHPPLQSIHLDRQV